MIAPDMITLIDPKGIYDLLPIIMIAVDNCSVTSCQLNAEVSGKNR
jgi:hypothetical protein